MEKKVFIENTSVETQTRFFENGEIVTDFCEFEQGTPVLANGNTRIKMRGVVTVTDGVGTQFHPYHETGIPTYNRLFNTPHGVLQGNDKNIVARLKLPRYMGKKAMLSALYNEMMQLHAYIKQMEGGTL
ncbi:MAG: hypothetical protein MJZ69_01555 [Bacteroidaceae bacterium]|nr:hypothetical protein [Bacteroidaceae bacterium]